MSRLAEKIVSPFFGKKKYYRIWNKLYKASMMGMNVGNGGDFESSRNYHGLCEIKNDDMQCIQGIKRYLVYFLYKNEKM